MMALPLETAGLSRGPSLAEQAYETLKTMIVEGSVEAGTVLSENDLSRQLSISRSPLREAIKRLQDERLLAASGPRGVTVPPITVKFVSDLYHLRAALETEAARLTEWPGEEPLAAANAAQRAARAAIDAGDPEPFTSADFEFHDLYVQRCGNELLIDHISRLRGPVQRVHRFAKPLADHMIASAQEHQVILAALTAQDRDGLVAAVRAHVDGVAARLAAHLKKDDDDD